METSERLRAMNDGTILDATPTMNALPKPPRAERRRRKRIQLSNPLVGRIGSHGALLLDLSDGGARIEHYNRLKTGSTATLRFDFEGHSVRLTCTVVGCRVARFASGDDGLTVYQSGLSFAEDDAASIELLKAITTTFVARALAEQVANAKGVKPVDVDHMPIFRGGVLSSNQFDSKQTEKDKHLIPGKRVATERGYIRCRLRKETSWTKVWTLDPEQPDEGFTVSVHEPSEQVEMLCQTYREATAEERQLIREMARLSISSGSR
jgi:hypothetical protein